MFYYVQLPNPIERLVPGVGFLGRVFGSFWSENGYFFEGTTECIIVFIISIPNEKERKRNRRIQNGFE